MGLLFWGDRPIKEAHNNIITTLFYFILFLKNHFGYTLTKSLSHHKFFGGLYM